MKIEDIKIGSKFNIVNIKKYLVWNDMHSIAIINNDDSYEIEIYDIFEAHNDINVVCFSFKVKVSSNQSLKGYFFDHEIGDIEWK